MVSTAPLSAAAYTMGRDARKDLFDGVRRSEIMSVKAVGERL